LGVQVAPVWFLAQYTFTLSLAHTSVTSNTILSSSSSMFTLLASAAVLRERITAAKLASVAAVMAGELAQTAGCHVLQGCSRHQRQKHSASISAINRQGTHRGRQQLRIALPALFCKLSSTV
jgi:hypothetical protein